MKLTDRAALILTTLIVLAGVAHAIYTPSATRSTVALVSPSPAAPAQCATVTLNGSTETILTGLVSGGCYRVSTNGKDIYYFAEPISGFDAGTADATQARLPDPGVEKMCLQTGQTKAHFFAAAATTATVCQSGQ